MKTKLSKKAIRQAENVKNCVEGLLKKYEEFKEKHPENTFEDAVITRIQNNYNILANLLPTTVTTIIKPCSILELERMIQKLIDEFYDTVEKEFDDMDPMKYNKQKHFDNANETCNMTARIFNDFDEIDKTIDWHFENICQ